jgi:high-affinity iron transporter
LNIRSIIYRDSTFANIAPMLRTTLQQRSRPFLCGLTFLVVFREVLETVLFYTTVWERGNGVPVLFRAGSAAVALATTAAVMLRLSKRLPIGKFFGYTSVLMGALAVVLVGKGVSALQEAGQLPVSAATGRAAPRHSRTGADHARVVSQVVVIALLLFAFTYNRRSQ